MPTTFNISFPNWFLAVFSLTFIGFVFYLGGLYIKVRDICKDHPKINQALIRISEILVLKKISTEYVYSASPMSLSEKGKEALKEAKFNEFYHENKDVLLKRIKEKSPKTMADLEDVCKSIMLSMEDTLPKFESIKQFAYSHGEPISNILFACAIALKDLTVSELNIK
ncbi:MAG: hypothetical protein WC901_06025 [Candidatus Margulisiibacteriota bacterium]